MCKKGFLCEAIKSYGKNQIKLMILVKCIVLNWVILFSEMVNVSLFFSQDLTWRHNTLPALLSVLIPPHGVHIVISGERERNTKDEKQEKWRSSRKERILSFAISFHPFTFFSCFLFFPILISSQTLRQALTSSLIANYLGRKMCVSPFGSPR